ncbi:cytochrome c [Endozoicomonas sp. SM1973]|uniref:Cytochrome c n=1 Tax=Spartinivicinus marinus TaxID=2994442 RepID=A0A853IBA6_9GAMM|nr:cytochrome c [Spartinivicinus marinus]MCX4024842.1 cytochrome c [Spartinivicinus marinus]NYZ66515.1 cytochrome c [Spartinivicinus marinus]
MSDRFTKGMARNIYYGGSAFFVLLFLALTFHTTRELPQRDHRENLTEAVANGKLIWEENNCIGCHTLLGEGAYYAPELGNVFYRRGGEDSFKAFFQGWMKAQPLNIPGRRQMPQFNLSDQEIDDLAEFLEWTSKIEVNDWPPNQEG